MPVVRPIIVIKKKVNHGGSHGGAWKVAVEVLVAFDEKLSDDLSVTHRKNASHGEMCPSSQQSPAERRSNLDTANTRRLGQPCRTNRRASACL